MSLFIALSDKQMITEINRAQKMVIFVAPSLRAPVAKALILASQKLGRDCIKIILDVSANVARLGYGEHTAVELLKNAELDVCQQHNLRAGVLICDQAGWCFFSSPRLVDAEVTEGQTTLNAIALAEEQIDLLKNELVPERANSAETLQIISCTPIEKNEVIDNGKSGDTTECDCVSSTGSVALVSAVGEKIVDTETVKKVATALKIAPPMSFNVARQTQVYTALIEFVELSFEGFNLQSRRIKLPKSLPIIATKDKGIKGRISASLKLLDQFDKPKELIDISEALEELRRAYLIPVGPAGRVMLKSKREHFESELDKLEKGLCKCKENLVAEINKALDSVINNISPELAKSVLQDPPPLFRGTFSHTEECAKEYVERELRATFPDAKKLVDNMKIHKFFKDVTYQTLTDKEFVKRVSDVIPKSVLDGALLSENVAAMSHNIL